MPDFAQHTCPQPPMTGEKDMLNYLGEVPLNIPDNDVIFRGSAQAFVLTVAKR